MSWQTALELLGLASIACCAVVCYAGYRSGRRRDLLPPPQPKAFRDAYSPRRYTVGSMRGVQ